MRLIATLLLLSLAACAFSVHKPCSEGVEPWRSTPVRGTKQCYQRKDPQGVYVNDGKFLEWHPNGRLATDGGFTMGKKDGKWSEWDESGRLTLEKWYSGGEEVPTSRPQPTPTVKALAK